MKSIGERIVGLMEKEYLTQKELATMAGVTESTLSRYINNERNPKAEILANIATALNTTSEFLLSGKESETDFNTTYGIVARGVKTMSEEEKKKLMRLLLDA